MPKRVSLALTTGFQIPYRDLRAGCETVTRNTLSASEGAGLRRSESNRAWAMLSSRMLLLNLILLRRDFFQHRRVIITTRPMKCSGDRFSRRLSIHPFSLMQHAASNGLFSSPDRPAADVWPADVLLRVFTQQPYCEHQGFDSAKAPARTSSARNGLGNAESAALPYRSASSYPCSARPRESRSWL
jgi:hypothetical protein